jgi:pre-mRNA-processing factor SLU7
MNRKPQEPAKNERNEYIPSFITKKPFYVPEDDSTTGADYLEHQRLQKAAQDQSKWYDRGKRAGPAATKFRKGACENCGAMTHKTKECLSRPRAKGARWTGKDIEADEVVQKVEMGWDAKRDRWNGYDAVEYQAVTKEYEEMEKLKKELKGEQGLLADGENADAEEAKYAEESDMGRQQSTATRNLRLREDTAKYLLNLDLDSAKYDPKTRSMMDSGATSDLAAALVAEDNFMRASGDAAEFEKAQRYAWETEERGDKNKVHIQANPTSGEYLRRKEKEEAEAKRAAHQKLLQEKYGAMPTPKNPLRDLAVMENERYVEYDESGAIKGAPKKIHKSKYAEDVYPNNHTSVWGSWWQDFRWGYACCHSTVKNSYCIGEEGRKPTQPLAIEEADQGLEEEDVKVEAVDEEVERAEDGRKMLPKRKIGDIKSAEDEEMEAYKKSRIAANDPMAKYLGKDEIVQ